MDFSKRLRDELPDDVRIKKEYSIDGDLVPTSISYRTNGGGTKRVPVRYTLDGDHLPETGYDIHSNIKLPNKKMTLDFF